MGLILKKAEGSGGKYTPAPAGSQPARCIAVIDLGTQTLNFSGETKSLKRVQLTWELAEQMEDGRPFTISKKYTNSLHERSTLRADLEAWRNKAFSPAEEKGFDAKKLLGQPCLLTIATTSAADGKVYSVVKQVVPMPKGMPLPPEPTNETMFFDLDEFDPEVFAKLGKYTQESISQTPEFASANGSAKSTSAAFEDEEIPF